MNSQEPMGYQEALDYLSQLETFGWHPGLVRIEKLMEILGNPEQDLRFVHVGGTNGKGSVTATLASVMTACGYRTGMFISPHLCSYRERIQIDGRLIPPERLASLVSYVRGKIREMTRQGYEHPTGFEVSTAIAILYFREEKTDLAVIEVGLGGAIDSTNVITPLVSVITNVTLDHMDYLGETVRQIAGVKAGIIKPGVPIITASEHLDALDVIRQEARAKEAPLHRVGHELYYNILSAHETGTRFMIKDASDDALEIFTPLVGAHQAVNGTTVMLVLRTLQTMGYVFDPEGIRTGFRRTRWPARLELVGTRPKILLDAAHNCDGANKLRRSLNTIYQYRRLIYVIGMLADKQRRQVLAKLGPIADVIVVTRPNSPRAGDWEAMAEEARNYTPYVYKEESIEKAVDLALAQAGPEDLVCITGSIYMVAEAREYILYEKKIGYNDEDGTINARERCEEGSHEKL